MVTTLVRVVSVNKLFNQVLSYLGVRMVTILARVVFVNQLFNQVTIALIKTQLALLKTQVALLKTQSYQNQTSPYLQQPFSQPQQQQQLVQLYNPSQVVACLNNVLAQSILKAGILNNNTRGITAGVNSTFMDNATKTLDNCIVPTTTMTR